MSAGRGGPGGASSFAFVEGATSDLSFVAWGASCEDALAASAEALLAATVEDPQAVGREIVRPLRLEAPDLDLLLLRFLNELVYLRDAEGLLLRAEGLRVERGPDGVRLEGRWAGEPWDPSRHRFAGEVKAATAHGLSLAEAGEGGWEARATLDV